MRGGEKVRLRQRLRMLKKAAEAGDRGAAGEALLLEAWLEDDDAINAKRADDRCKVIIGAWVAAQIKAGRPVALDDASALLAALDNWLVRPRERLAVLGQDHLGSPAFRRVTGLISLQNQPS